MIPKLSYLNNNLCEIEFLRVRNPKANYQDGSSSGFLMVMKTSVGMFTVISNLDRSWKIYTR